MSGAGGQQLRYTIRQQDGALVEMTCANTVHNRQFVDFVRRHEGFAKLIDREGSLA